MLVASDINFESPAALAYIGQCGFSEMPDEGVVNLGGIGAFGTADT